MGCGASSKAGSPNNQEDPSAAGSGKQEGANKESKPEVDLNENFTTITFTKTDVEAVDAAFDKTGKLIDQFLEMNLKLVSGVQEVIKHEATRCGDDAEDDTALNKTASKVLALRLKDAVLGARDAMEHAMPENVGEIRKKAQEAKDATQKALEAKGDDQKPLQDEAKAKLEEAAKMAATALPKLKTLLPKVEGTKISFPEGIDMTKLKPEPKAALDVVQKFFDTLQEIGTTSIVEIKGKVDAVTADIKGLGSKLPELCKEKTKDMGMVDKGKYMKSMAETVASNAKLSAVLKSYMDKVVAKLTVIGKIIVDAFSQAITTALQYAPSVVAAVQGAVQEAKDSAAKVADAHKDEINALGKNAKEAGEKAGLGEKVAEAVGPKGAPPAEATKEAEAKAVAPQAEAAKEPAAPKTEAGAPAGGDAATAVENTAAAAGAPAVEASAEKAPTSETPAPAAEAAAAVVEVAAAPAAAAEAAAVATPVVEASAEKAPASETPADQAPAPPAEEDVPAVEAPAAASEPAGEAGAVAVETA